MHYGPLAFSKNGKPTIEPKQKGITIGQVKWGYIALLVLFHSNSVLASAQRICTKLIGSTIAQIKVVSLFASSFVLIIFAKLLNRRLKQIPQFSNNLPPLPLRLLHRLVAQINVRIVPISQIEVIKINKIYLIPHF
jgi:hypothetical protein